MTQPAPLRYALDDLRHLQPAMTYKGKGESGQACFHWAAALALDLRASLLTFATLRAATPEEQASMPGASPEPFIHAWVELGPWVYAPTTIPRMGGVLVPFSVTDYYERNGVSDVHRLPRATFEAIARSWRLSAAFKHKATRAGSGELVDELLRAAGVRYRVSARRSVLPILKETQ